ncbi:MAG: 3-isopropylmalate dehydratase large subunit, partial [Thermodesulfobacteriota bacterium]|nr:3-isopropylmalate dehydratase large subunit [Thermodesulfobacteriota bacterium]
MGMTITEKILANHAGLKEVNPGQLIQSKVDIVLANDITAPLAIEQFRAAGAKKVFDPEKVVIVADHFAPNKDILSAEQCRFVREFAQEQKLTHFYEGGEMGVEHALLPEKGIVKPGEVIIGADSHTCTYGALGAFATGVGSTDVAAAWITGETWFRVPESIKFVFSGTLQPWVSGKDLILHTIGDIGVDGALYKAMEFTGEVIHELSMADRFSMANMAIEAGAKSGIIVPDVLTEHYVRERVQSNCQINRLASDDDAPYTEVKEYNINQLEPQVACPHSPENVKRVSEVGKILIDQAVIGSCTNGRLEDLHIAARILKGKKAAPSVRLIIIPATPWIYQEAMRQGLFEIFLNANAVISPPTCGPCLGGHMGILAKGEKAIATTNRNFVGRMGHQDSELYLASPAVAAASAVQGYIASPEQIE